MGKIRIIDWIEEETGYRLEGWQKAILEREFPVRLPRKLKKAMKKRGI